MNLQIWMLNSLSIRLIWETVYPISFPILKLFQIIIKSLLFLIQIKKSSKKVLNMRKWVIMFINVLFQILKIMVLEYLYVNFPFLGQPKTRLQI